MQVYQLTQASLLTLCLIGSNLHTGSWQKQVNTWPFSALDILLSTNWVVTCKVFWEQPTCVSEDTNVIESSSAVAFP